MAQTLIKPQTAAVTTERQFKVHATHLPATLEVVGLSGTEQIPILFSPDNGTTWQELFIKGSQVVLDATSNAWAVDSCMLLGVTKPATANPVGVYISIPSDL